MHWEWEKEKGTERGRDREYAYGGIISPNLRLCNWCKQTHTSLWLVHVAHGEANQIGSLGIDPVAVDRPWSISYAGSLRIVHIRLVVVYSGRRITPFQFQVWRDSQTQNESWIHLHSPELKSGIEACGREGRIPDVTIVGTELVMELGGASMPDGCNGGSGGGGPVAKQQMWKRKWITFWVKGK